MPISIYEDLPTLLDKLEQELGRMGVPDRTIVWDDIDIPPTVSSLAGFQMLDIEKLSGIGCP